MRARSTIKAAAGARLGNLLSTLSTNKNILINAAAMTIDIAVSAGLVRVLTGVERLFELADVVENKFATSRFSSPVRGAAGEVSPASSGTRWIIIRDIRREADIRRDRSIVRPLAEVFGKLRELTVRFSHPVRLIEIDLAVEIKLVE